MIPADPNIQAWGVLILLAALAFGIRWMGEDDGFR